MKKILFAFAFVAVCGFVSCGNKTVDGTVADSVVVDSLDTCVCDTVDTVLVDSIQGVCNE